MPNPLHSSSRLVTASLAAATLAAGLLLSGCGKSENKTMAKTPDHKLETVDQRASYGIGYSVGSNLARQRGLALDQTAFQAGLNDALAKSKPKIDEDVIRAAFGELDQRVSAQAAEEGKANLAAGNAYLEKNRAKPGVTTTASGLQYEVLKKGSGAKPSATSTVSVHYHGTLINGTVFDSSVERKEPAEFAVNQVIPGWTEALQLMSVGDKWKLTIPAAIAYGPRANGEIPANSVLIFEVELLAIK